MSKKTLTINRQESLTVTFADWFPMVRGDFKTEQHAINHWEEMCHLNGNEWNDDVQLDIEDCEDILAELAEEVEIEHECESCGYISEDNIVHSFGCVELCEKCSYEGHEPHCPKKHADSASDPCDWCEEQWAAADALKQKREAEAALLEASLATPAPPPPEGKEAEPDVGGDMDGLIDAYLTSVEATHSRFATYPTLPGTLEERLAAADKEAEEQKEREEVAVLMRMVREKAKKIGMKLKIEEE